MRNFFSFRVTKLGYSATNDDETILRERDVRMRRREDEEGGDFLTQYRSKRILF
jgi:hypothetical protein